MTESTKDATADPTNHSGGGGNKEDDGDSEERLTRWGSFRNPLLEAVFLDNFRYKYSSLLRVFALMIGLFAVLGATMVYVGLREHTGRVCPDKLFIYFSGGVLFVVAATVFPRPFITSARIFGWMQSVCCFLCGAIFASLAITTVYGCPSSTPTSSSSPLGSLASSTSSSSSSATKSALEPLPPSVLITVMSIVYTFAFVHFGSVPWPQSLYSGVASMLAFCAALVACVPRDAMNLFYVAIALIGHLAIFISAFTASASRRHDFAAVLRLEREFAFASGQKDATARITRALFPPGIAERLIATRAVSTNRDRALSCYEKLRPSEYMESTIIADPYDCASVVAASFGSVEDVEPWERQIELLSHLFIAAEHVADSAGAVKVKTDGPMIVFLCSDESEDATGGIRSGSHACSGCHSQRACELAIDIQRMLAGFTAEKLTEHPITVAIGVTCGPLASGVIGIARPRFDIWGKAARVAEKLAQFAPPGTIMCNREIARNEKSNFRFSQYDRPAVLPGIGRVKPFVLAPTDSHDVIQPDLKFTRFTLPQLKRKPLHEVAKTAWRRPTGQIFPMESLEIGRRFLVHLIPRTVSATRWLSLSAALFLAAFYALSIAQGYSVLMRHVFTLTQIVSWLTVFGLSFTPLTRSATFICVQYCVVALIVLISQGILWLTLTWSDRSVCGLAMFFVWAAGTRMPFLLATTFILIGFLANVPPLVARFGYAFETVIIGFSLMLICVLGHFDWEYTARASFALKEKLVEAEAAANKEQAESQKLVSSAIPVPVVERLTRNGEFDGMPFLSEFIESATILTCTICGFDAILKRLTPGDVVRLLNALFSHLDFLAGMLRLEPLKTLGDAYIVVANSLGDMSRDHQKRAVELGISILGSLEEFNRRSNPVSEPISVRIGIHTDAILSGIIHTKSAIFDCWGDGFGISEAVAAAAAPNGLLISATTREAVAGKYFTSPCSALDLEGGELLQLFYITGAALSPSQISTDSGSVVPSPPDSPISGTPPSPRIGGIALSPRTAAAIGIAANPALGGTGAGTHGAGGVPQRRSQLRLCALIKQEPPSDPSRLHQQSSFASDGLDTNTATATATVPVAMVSFSPEFVPVDGIEEADPTSIPDDQYQLSTTTGGTSAVFLTK